MRGVSKYWGAEAYMQQALTLGVKDEPAVSVTHRRKASGQEFAGHMTPTPQQLNGARVHLTVGSGWELSLAETIRSSAAAILGLS